ncbi:MAG: Fur family transcriptional regulator [Eubacteriales bacterium]|jgi:Fur family ferric uptake transcriptional regulator
MAGLYRTKQRELIYSFLKKNSDLHITAEEISDHLKRQGSRVGKATIYRYLDRLVADNVVRKYHLGSGTSACYQYIEDKSRCAEHFHLKCIGCGELIHMECNDLERFFCHLRDKHDFKADPTQTVVYGECAKCLEK